MPTFLAPLPLTPYIEWPKNPVEWIGLFLMGALVLWGIYHWRERDEKWTNWKGLALGGLVPVVILTSLFFGFRLSAEGFLPRPLLPEEPRGPALMFFVAVPWLLAGGILGPVAAAMVGALSGLVTALFDTHSLFTVIQGAAIALLFSVAVRQRYRTPVYRLLRHPLLTVFLLGFVFAPIYITSAILEQSGPLAARVDFAITRVSTASVAVWIELLIAGIVAEIIARFFPKLWGKRGSLIPSPSESSLQLRFFYGTGPYVLILLSTLMVGDWIVAGRAARTMLEEQLSTVARMASESMPYFLEAGHHLIRQTAGDPRLSSASRQDLPDILAENLRSMPYFQQVFLFDAAGKPVTGYPEEDHTRLALSPEEETGIQLALEGVSIQTYNVPSSRGGTTAQISFIASVEDENGKIRGVLLGRSDLATNPYTNPVIKTLEEMHADENGTQGGGAYGVIVDESGKILYHPIPSRVMSEYLGKTSTAPDFFDETGPEGTRNLVYYQPVAGRSWAVILIAPAQRAQQLALTIAVPLLLLILLLAVLIIVSLRLGLSVLSASLHNLSLEAGQISQGKLDHPFAVKGVDEVGRLSATFEQMRMGLKSRMEELNLLLGVSQGVAASLRMEDAAQPVLEAALSDGASAARIVLAADDNQAVHPDLPARFGVGIRADDYAALDNQIIALTRQRDRVVLGNLTRGRILTFPPDSAHPNALIAVALRHENLYYGTLWVGYDQPRTFQDDEVRFLVTLAGQAALAAANARLYATAEIGRQRLEAVLASTPDAVLVTDQQNRLLLVNPAAKELSGLMGVAIEGQPIQKVLPQNDLMNLLHNAGDEQVSREIPFTNGKIYYATVSSIVVENQTVGRVCILRDITHFKEVDTLKSDFVATVSHDLRSPLTLMRGYATMLQMVGDLNDQQKNYMRKIISGVESMSRLVSNLLDLGRIEAGVGLQLERVVVNDIVARVVNSLQLQATQKKIQLNQELPEGDGPVIDADSALLQQAFYNLVENAIKYTPVGGEVNLRVQEQTASILFEIMDTGTGIAPLDQPHLFEKFYRGGPKDVYQQRGSGLGLAIVKSIAERHGGRVWVESYLGRGSTFFLEIPVSQAILAGE